MRFAKAFLVFFAFASFGAWYSYQNFGGSGYFASKIKKQWNPNLEPNCSGQPGQLPFPNRLEGERDGVNPIKHIVVIMQENRSFDTYFGKLNQAQFYGSELDGITDNLSNPDKDGNPVHVYREDNMCIADIPHMWNHVHETWNGGKMDGFVVNGQSRAMAYYDHEQLPYYYALANEFAIGDRYFSSVLSSTYPNRYFLMAGTAFGHWTNDEPKNENDFNQPTLFDSLTKNKISWKYYTDDKTGYFYLFGSMFKRNKDKMAKMSDYFTDLKNGTLPEVVFVDSVMWLEDEHPSADVQNGQYWVAKNVKALMESSAWKDSALFLVYDENGGFYDHVAPPKACKPDNIPLNLPDWAPKAEMDKLGVRVPFVAVSPYAKRHYVSHEVYDHTSVLKFIQKKFNLPYLSYRDANANSLDDVFDYKNQNLTQPELPTGEPNPTLRCKPDEVK